MDSLKRLLEFLTEIERRKISYRLEHIRAEALMVIIAVPGQRLEVEFFSDGQIELERFGPSSGVTATTLDELTHLLNRHSDGAPKRFIDMGLRRRVSF
jgi:hypothetical protein